MVTFILLLTGYLGLGGVMAEQVRALACTGDRTVPAGFESHCGKLRFGTLAIPFTPICQCLSEETLKAVGRFYLVSMPGEVKDPASPHWNVYPVTVVDSTTHSKPHWSTANYNTRQEHILDAQGQITHSLSLLPRGRRDGTGNNG